MAGSASTTAEPHGAQGRAMGIEAGGVGLHHVRTAMCGREMGWDQPNSQAIP